MSFAMCCRRSASRVASSVCGSRSISTVVNRPSLVLNPSPLRPFVSRGFLYSTAAVDDAWISSEQAVLREIDSEFNAPVMLNKKNVLETFFMCIRKDHSKGRMTPPASFPFKIEDIPGSRSVTLTREYNGEHIKVVVSMPPPLPNDDGGPSNESKDDDAPSNESNDVEDDDAPSNESIDHGEDDAPSNESNDVEDDENYSSESIDHGEDDAPSNESNDEDDASSSESDDERCMSIYHGEDDAPSNESNDEDDASSSESDDERCMSIYPLVVNVTKKSGRSLELRCRASSDDITIDDIHVNLPGHSSEDPKVIRDMDDTVGSEHENVKETLNEYLKIRGLDESTINTITSYMLDKMKHEYWLWLDNVKEFLEE